MKKNSKSLCGVGEKQKNKKFPAEKKRAKTRKKRAKKINGKQKI